MTKSQKMIACAALLGMLGLSLVAGGPLPEPECGGDNIMIAAGPLPEPESGGDNIA